MDVNTVITNFLSRGEAVFVAWILINMLVFVAAGAAIRYAWDKKNIKAILENEPDRKRMLKTTFFPHLSDEQIARILPSIIGSAFYAAGGEGVIIALRYFVDGPHISENDSRPWIRGILSRKMFGFAARMMGGVLRPNDMGYVILHLIVAFLSFTLLWGLFPYCLVIFGHYRRIFVYVCLFGKDQEFTSMLYRRPDWEEWKEDILNFQRAYSEKTGGKDGK